MAFDLMHTNELVSVAWEHVQVLQELRESVADEEWLEVAAKNVALWSELVDRSALALGLVLWTIFREWDTLKMDALGEWGYDFWTWAEGVTQYHKKTLRNFMNLARTFVVEAGQLPEWFDPWQVPHSKLLLIAGHVNAGKADEELLRMAADPQVTWAALRDHLHRSNQMEEKPWVRTWLSGPMLLAARGDGEDEEIVELGELNLQEYGYHPLVTWCLDRIFKVLDTRWGKTDVERRMRDAE